MLHSSVQEKCRRISVCLTKLDNRLVATNLNHMLWADMVRGEKEEEGRGGRAVVESGVALRREGRRAGLRIATSTYFLPSFGELANSISCSQHAAPSPPLPSPESFPRDLDGSTWT